MRWLDSAPFISGAVVSPPVRLGDAATEEGGGAWVVTGREKMAASGGLGCGCSSVRGVGAALPIHVTSGYRCRRRTLAALVMSGGEGGFTEGRRPAMEAAVSKPPPDGAAKGQQRKKVVGRAYANERVRTCTCCSTQKQ